MSFGNQTENDLMAFIFNKTAIPWGAQNDFYIALHTADPGEAGDQTTSEAAYTGYARRAITRGAGDFTVTGNQVINAALEQFDPCTAGTAALTHWSIGLNVSGASQIICRGPLSATRNISAGIQPQFAAGVLSASLD